MRNKSKPTSPSRNRRNRKSAANQLGFEKLEDRKLLASLAFDSVSQAGSDVGSVQVYSVAVDSVGNSYLGGLFYSKPVDFDLDNSHVGDVDILTPRGDNDAFLAKYDANNNFVWARRMGGDAIRENANSPFERLKEVVVDSQDNVLIAGEFTESADFGSFTLNSAGSGDVFLAKLDGDGNFLWANQWGTATRDFGSTLEIDANDRVTAVGFTTILETNGAWTANGIEIHQFDTGGSENWTQQIPSYGATAGHIATDALGNVIVTGDFAGTVDMDASSNVSNVSGSSTVSGGAGRNSYILKLDSGGSFQWASSLVAKTSEDSSSSAWAAEVLVDASGDIVIAGQYYGQADLDPGANDLRLPAASPGSYLAKLDSGSGSLVSLQSIGEGITIRDLAASGSNYYATGSYQNTATPGSGWTLTSNGASDVFVMELSQTGYVKNVIGLGESSNDFGYSIATDDSGGVYVAGTFRGDVDFDPDLNNSHVLSNSSFTDAFLLKLNAVPASEPIIVFEDSFEVSEWNGNWVEDSQNDWFRSTQRSTDGTRSAEVDGRASNATLTIGTPIDLSAFTSVQLTFDWLIESGFDSGEYLSLDISTDGGASWQNDVRRLSGNVDSENVWHSESVDLLGYASSNVSVRYRSSVSGSSEDANVDNVRIVGVQADLGPNENPVANAGGPYFMDEGSSISLNGTGSIDSDGSIVSYAWDLDQDGQFDDASGATINFSTTQSGPYVVGLQVTDNRGATAETTASVTVNNVAPTASAGGDQSGFLGNPVNVSASGSFDAGNDITSYAWDLNDDGQYDDAFGINAQFTASSIGTYSVGVQVTDADGASSIDSATITVAVAPSEVVLFEDSFEVGSNNNDWNGKWQEDSQNDFFRSTQRSTDGSWSAEVDGYAGNATLTLATPINVQGYSSVELTFDWLIEKGFDAGEYLTLDISTNGGSSWQPDVRRLSGNVDAENTWHYESVELTNYTSSNLLIRFRSYVSSSREDANIDNVKIVASNTSWAGLALSGMQSDSMTVSIPSAKANTFKPSMPISQVGDLSGAVTNDSGNKAQPTNDLNTARRSKLVIDKVFADFSADSSFETLIESKFANRLESAI